MNTFTSIDRNKPSQTDTKDPKHKKYAQTTHKNLINLGEDTRTPTINTPRQQHERQPTHTIGSPHPNRKIYSVGILESRSTKIILLSICMRTRVRTWRKREETTRQPQEWEREQKTNHLERTNGSRCDSSNESSVEEEESREERKPWRRDLTSMTWSPVIF